MLAHDLIASMPLPPFKNFAVDGYAIRFADIETAAGAPLTVADQVVAGASAKGYSSRTRGAHLYGRTNAGRLGHGLHAGGRSGRRRRPVHFPTGLCRGANVRPVGEDISAGSVVLPRGRRLRPQDVAVCAALGLTELQVRRSVRVAVFSTGDEIVSPGSARGPSQLFELEPFHAGRNAPPPRVRGQRSGYSRHDPILIADALRQAAAGHDFILASGGVSTGEADHVKAGVESAGKLAFWRVAIKPGRPIAMGSINGVPFMGLPGNPVASFVTFVYLARSAVLALAGTDSEPFTATPVRAAFAYRKKAGRREYARAKVRRGADGALEAVKFPREGAGLLSSLIKTEGLVELPELATLVEPGAMVAFFPYSVLL